MKFSIITVAVLVVVMLTSTVDAWGYGGRGFGGWGYGGGYGGGWGGYGMGGYGMGGYGMGGYGIGMGYGYPSYGGYGYGKRATLEAPTRLECLYLTKAGGINCNKGFIECEASLDITGLEKFDMFGVGIVNDQIRLYPKNFTTSLYGDFKMLSNDLSSPELSIFLNGTNGSKGIMVKDSVCYNKIVGLVKSISSPVMSWISSDVKISVSGFILDV